MKIVLDFNIQILAIDEYIIGYCIFLSSVESIDCAVRGGATPIISQGCSLGFAVQLQTCFSWPRELSPSNILNGFNPAVGAACNNSCAQSLRPVQVVTSCSTIIIVVFRSLPKTGIKNSPTSPKVKLEINHNQRYFRRVQVGGLGCCESSIMKRVNRIERKVVSCDDEWC